MLLNKFQQEAIYYEQKPLTYTKLAFKENGLQDYMDAIEEFN